MFIASGMQGTDIAKCLNITYPQFRYATKRDKGIPFAKYKQLLKKELKYG